MRVLLIEDETDFIAKVKAACDASASVKLETAEEYGLLDMPIAAGTAPVEDQLLVHLQNLLQRQRIDLVLLDTDLSRAQAKLRTQTEYRQAFQSLGIPVARYRKGQSETPLAKLDFLRRLARDGASAIYVPPDRRDENALAESLVPWLIQLEAGFSELNKLLAAQPTLLETAEGPAGILATLLDRPALKSDLLGYTSPNFFFFPIGEDGAASAVARHSTQLGYWLHNYILAFPGPILNSVAAAAFLNLTSSSFETPALQALIAGCQYGGPFSGVDAYYWKDELGTLLDSLDGDITNAGDLKGATLTRVDESPYAAAYYCVLTHEPIRLEEAAVNPDWIPAGASVTRIKESEFDELGPMLRG